MKLKKKNILVIGILAVAGLFGTASAVVNQKVNEEPVVEKAEAGSVSKARIVLELEDQCWSTSDSRDPILHLWSISVDSSMGYDTTSTDTLKDDMDAANIVADLEKGGANIAQINNDGSIDTGMSWIKEENSKRYWYVNLPWYITGFKFKLHCGSYWTKTESNVCEVTKRGSHMVYNYGSWNSWETSLTQDTSSKSNSYSVTNYSISTAKSGGGSSTAQVKGNGGSYTTSGNYFPHQKISLKATPASGYTFTSWSAGNDTTSATTYDYVGTANKTYTATFAAVPTYTLSGSVTTNTSYNFGTVSSNITGINSGTSYTISSNKITVGSSNLTATPTADTAEWDYSFWKWTDTSGNALSNGTITGDLNVVAWFKRAKQTYTITWKNGDGTTIETDSGVAYGTTPSYDGATPTKTATAQYTYTWDEGWTPTPSSVSGNATYTATFSSTVNTYTVTWKNYDDTTLETDSGVAYGTTPTYDGATPTKSPEGTTTYSFSGWSPSVGAITGNTTYTAQFEEHSVDPSASGWYGGEVYYAVDEYNRYGNPNYFRICFYDSDDSTSYFTYSYSDLVVTTVNGKNVYKVVIPEYTGSSDLGWTKFVITEYKNNTDTSPNWDDNRVYQTGDLYASFWKNYNRWWIKDTDGSGQIKMGYDNESTYNGMLSGNTYYLEIMDDSWDSGKYKAIYFHTPVDSSGSGDAWALCRKIEGITSGFTYGLYEFVAPTTSGGVSVTWSKFIVVELTSGTTLDWDNKNKQSPASGGYTIENPLVNTVKSNGGSMYQISDAQRLGFFDTYFNTQIGGECKSDGSTNITNLKTKWTNVSNQLPMDSTIANQFKTETPNEKGDANQQAAARYDYVLNKYQTSQGLSDFANRKNGGHFSYSAVRSFSPFTLIIGDDESNLSTIIIIAASSVALLSVTALSILVIKKRKNKEE